MVKKQTKKPTKLSFWKRHPYFKLFVVVIVLLLVTTVAMVVAVKMKTEWRQSKLQPFYDTTGLSLEGPLGEVVRKEPLGIDIDGGSGMRVLYRTQKSNGEPTFSSGMIFTPNSPLPTSGYPVVAWAHGTIGMGDQCAPTRTTDPTSAVDWTSDMLKQGWVVTATDYAGLGTPGVSEYLVGESESNDVLNSVRAARSLPEVHASDKFAIWGHSQGGHAALFSAANTKAYMPENMLVGTVAAAPAAELSELLSEQYNTSVGWIIGPEVAISWPNATPTVRVSDVVTQKGQNNYQQIAHKCIEAGAIDGMIRTKLKQQFFSKNPLDVPAWSEELQKQTAPILPPSEPLMVIESTADSVVLPDTTALYIQKACNAGSDLTALWLAEVNHVELAGASSPNAISWLVDRFANKPTTPNCDQASPVAPAKSV